MSNHEEPSTNSDATNPESTTSNQQTNSTVRHDAAHAAEPPESTTSNQQTNIDWSAVNSLFSTLADAAKTKIPQRPDRFNRIITITTTLVTVLTLVATILIQYINTNNLAQQNQDFQVKFANLQREATQASIELSSFTTSLTNISFTLNNQGQAAATNVKIIISMFYIHKAWRQYINSINDFTIDLSDPSLVISIKSIHTNIPGTQQVLGENAEEIILNSLPRSEDFTIGLDLSPAIPTKTYNFNGDNNFMNVYFKATNKQSQANNTPDLAEIFASSFFNDMFAVAAFNISANCDNCAVSSGIFNVPAPFSAHSLGYILPIRKVVVNGFIEDSLNIEGSYMIPKNEAPINIKFPISFQIQQISTFAPETPQSYAMFHDLEPLNLMYGLVWPNISYNICSLSICTTNFFPTQ